MAKSRRASSARISARKPARGKATPYAGRPARADAVRPVAVQARPAPPEPPSAPARKPTYHEAVALYERGLQALQRHDFAAAADALRNVIERYPDERELLERARLYLKVCERELMPRQTDPRTAEERVYAATVALNDGDESAAVHHLQRALSEDPEHDHAHYMMAVAMTRRQDAPAALEHLRRAIMFNAENRGLAKQDPDLEPLRESDGFRAVLETPSVRQTTARPAAPKVPPRRVRR
jgi:Tfp pilus assembly protein PilF